MITFSSKKQLDEQKQEFPLLPAEDYRLKIVNVEETTQNKYQSEEIEDIVKGFIKDFAIEHSIVLGPKEL